MPRIVRFATFQADLDGGELFRDGIKLKLGGQPFQVLAYLLARPGEIVTREELRTALWQADTFVDFDQGLNTAINKIREALGDSASNPRFVETVPRKGYRFVGQVDRPMAAEPKPERAVAVPGRSKRWMLPAAAVLGVAVMAGAFLRLRTDTQPVQYKLTQVTRDTGLTHQPSLSADGNFVVYASDRATGKDLDIWIQHVSGGQPVRLTSTPADESHPTLSADGRKVAFQTGSNNSANSIYVIPALGGTPKLLTPVGQHPQIAPGGEAVLYATGAHLLPSELQLVSTEGGTAQTIRTGLGWAMAPLWTRDGKHLLAWAGCRGLGACDYYSVAAAGGKAQKTGVVGELQKAGVASRAMLMVGTTDFPVAAVGADGIVAAAKAGDGSDLWWIPLRDGVANGRARRITVGAEASHPSIAATGRIAFSRLSVNTGMWMLPLDRATGRAAGEPQRVGRESASRNYPNLSADGKKLAYVSNRGGNQDVWIRDLDSGEDRQLTASAADEFRASISPDGKFVAYTVNRDLITMPSAGGVEKVICRNCAQNVVMWSPDGSKLMGYWGTPIRHGTIDVATGRKQDLIVHPASDVHNGRFSPDGRWLTLTLVAEGNRAVYITSVENGAKPEAWIRIQGEGMPQSSFWSADGNLLYIHLPGGLWAVNLDPATKMPVGERFLVRQLGGPSFVPLFSANGISAQALYFMALETSANVWIADPVSR